MKPLTLLQFALLFTTPFLYTAQFPASVAAQYNTLEAAVDYDSEPAYDDALIDAVDEERLTDDVDTSENTPSNLGSTFDANRWQPQQQHSNNNEEASQAEANSWDEKKIENANLDDISDFNSDIASLSPVSVHNDCPVGELKSRLTGQCYKYPTDGQQASQSGSTTPVSTLSGDAQSNDSHQQRHSWFSLHWPSFRRHTYSENDPVNSFNQKPGFFRRFLNIFRRKPATDEKQQPSAVSRKVAVQQQYVDASHEDQTHNEQSVSLEAALQQQQQGLQKLEEKKRRAMMRQQQQLLQSKAEQLQEAPIVAETPINPINDNIELPVKQSHIIPFTDSELQQMPQQQAQAVQQIDQPLQQQNNQQTEPTQTINEQRQEAVESSSGSAYLPASTEQDAAIQHYPQVAVQPSQIATPSTVASTSTAAASSQQPLLDNSHDLNLSPFKPQSTQLSRHDDDVIVPIAALEQQTDEHSSKNMAQLNTLSTASSEFPVATLEAQSNFAAAQLPLPLKTQDSANDIRVIESPVSLNRNDNHIDLQIQYQQGALKHTILCQLYNGIHGHAVDAAVVAATAVTVNQPFAVLKVQIPIDKPLIEQRHEVRCYMADAVEYMKEPRIAQANADSVSFVHLEVNQLPTKLSRFVMPDNASSAVHVGVGSVFLIIMTSVVVMML